MSSSKCLFNFRCDEVIDAYNKGRLTATPGITLEQTLEAKVSKLLSEIRADAGKMCMNELPTSNTYPATCITYLFILHSIMSCLWKF